MEHTGCSHSATRRATAACEAAAAPAAAPVEMTSFTRYRNTENAPRLAAHAVTTAALVSKLNDRSDTRPTQWH
jgi:hypothetical protein